MKLHVRPGSLYRASVQPSLSLRPSLRTALRKLLSFSRTISSVGFPLNFDTTAIPPSNFLKLSASKSGSGKLMIIKIHKRSSLDKTKFTSSLNS